MIVKTIESHEDSNAKIINYVQRPRAALKMMHETRIDDVIVAEIKKEQFFCMVSQPGIEK